MSQARSVHRIVGAALAVVLLATIAGCGRPGPATVPADSSGDAKPQTQKPLPTAEADWQDVADALGRAGKLNDSVVYRVPLPRSDLTVVSHGVTIKPGLSLGGYASFARYADATTMMGDLVVTEAELPKVTDALHAQGIDQTALHKHLLEQSPAVWWTHFHAMGDAVKLAESLKTVLDTTATPPPAAAPTQQPSIDLVTAAIDQTMGRTGTNDGGIYKFTIARQEPILDHGHELPPAFGVTTAINFQPLGGDKAAINGDFAMIGPEVQDVIRHLRQGGIDIVELHNHLLTDHPRLFYVHFWAVDDADTLAKALRATADATNAKPAS